MRYVIIAVILLFASFLCLLNHNINVAEERAAAAQAQWVDFTMRHHCAIVRNPSFGNPTTTWRCDGNFEVVR